MGEIYGFIICLQMRGSGEVHFRSRRKFIARHGLIYPSFSLLFSSGLFTFRHR